MFLKINHDSLNFFMMKGVDEEICHVFQWDKEDKERF